MRQVVAGVADVARVASEASETSVARVVRVASTAGAAGAITVPEAKNWRDQSNEVAAAAQSAAARHDKTRREPRDKSAAGGAWVPAGASKARSLYHHHSLTARRDNS